MAQKEVALVNANPLILTQPNDVLLPPGAAAIFSVAATGPTLTYFWLHNATPISGETNATLTRNPALAPDQGTYQVIISNFAGVATSRLANLVFDASALRIVAQPQSLAVTQGQAASFTVTASGVQPLSYQWFFASAPALDATNSVLSFAAADATNAGAYFVVVTNEYRSVTSAVAGLTLVAPALAAAAVAGPPILAIETRAEHLLIICRGAPGQLHRLLQATTLGPDAAWEPVLTNAMPASGQLLWTRPRPTRGTTYFRAASP